MARRAHRERPSGRRRAATAAIVGLLGATVLLGACSSADSTDAGASSTTAADQSTTSPSSTSGGSTGTAGGSDASPAALCEASSDTADLAAREELLDALEQAYLDTELETSLPGGESLSLMSCEGDRAEVLHETAGTRWLIVYVVGDDGFTVDAEKDQATACADPDLSTASSSALAC